MTMLPLNDDAWRDWRDEWSLAEGVTYLNNGSFGPTPRAVSDARRQWMEAVEADPQDFLLRQLGPRLAEVRRRLGELVGTEGDNLALVDNASVAMNIVAASVRLQAGDEVLANDHEYGAVLRLWQRACDRAGAKLIVQPLPVPIASADEVVETLFAAAGARTKLLVVSHVTSPTAIVLPVEAICRRARELGLATCIDGPHAIAMLDVQLDRLDCDYYTASCHKWLCGPLGTGFLYVHPRRQAAVEPALVSWGRTLEGDVASWRDEFNWVGTCDPSAYLAVPAAIDLLARAGFDFFRRRTHALAAYARESFAGRLGSEALVPDSPQWYGSMISLRLPEGEAEPLQRALWQRYKIEVPIVSWQGLRLVRPSCHLYTWREDIDRLVNAAQEILEHGNSMK
ncbi:MAG TPA: aminotransferase class V-fold PLP-dependent enzyme [Pirellulales bacterium]|nr:aminotransferase class V-fold PLP-dependent enzyme [Pirellulales bacterium]